MCSTDPQPRCSVRPWPWGMPWGMLARWYKCSICTVLHGTLNSVHFTGKAECVNCGVIVILSLKMQLLAKYPVKTNMELFIP